MDNCCNDLPLDVVIEILSRLPVKSLLRFKCVCKYFFRLIGSANFIQKHLESTTLDDSLFLVHRDLYTNEDVISLFTAQKIDQGPEKVRIPSKRQCFVHITGPCHGLFCLYDYFEDLFLWNPATKEIKDLPKPGHMLFPPESKLSSVNFGFGFDPTRNDYKVIRLEQPIEPEHEPHHVEIYELSTNSWRKMINAGFPADIWKAVNSTATYANGVYYWWGCNWSADDRRIVISFDMADEVFHITPLPNFWNDCFFVMFFTTWNESLAVILPCERDNSFRFAIWRMNGYGNEANWTNLLSFTIGSRIAPMGIWNKKSDHELIFYNGYGRVVSVNLKTQATKVLIPEGRCQRNLRRFFPIEAVTYKESLVSFSRLAFRPK